MIGSADAKGQSLFLHFKKPAREEIKQGSLNLDLNKLMQNVGGEFFDYGTFKAAYDTDPRVKTMVKNFSEQGIEAKTANQIADIPQGGSETGSSKVSQMAKRATDLTDL